MQLELLPLEITQLYPPARRSADIAGIGEAVDGLQYVVKTPSKRMDLPATEWFCSCLADAVDLPIPPFRKVILPNGELGFGSRWEGGVQQNYNAGVLTARLPLSQGDRIFAAIYAFDLFVHNVDRHANNYVFREQNGRVVAMAMDFSRALLFHGWPLPAPPVGDMENTRATYKQICRNYPFDLGAAERVLLLLAKLPTDTVEGILNSTDATWLDANMKQNIADWWNSRARKHRLVDIRRGLRNGQYL